MAETGPIVASRRSVLKRGLSWLAVLVGCAFGLALVVSAGSYLAATVPEPVAATVVDDSSLSSLVVGGVTLRVEGRTA